MDHFAHASLLFRPVRGSLIAPSILPRSEITRAACNALQLLFIKFGIAAVD
jgi:hypothetical protein